MPIALSFVHPNGENIDNILDYFEIEILQFEITITKKANIDNSLRLVKCSNVTYLMHNEFVVSLQNRTHDYYCMKHNELNNFKNAYTEPDSQFINLFFTPCNSDKKACPKDLNEILSNFYVTMTFINAYFDSNNYLQPIQYYEYTNTQQISNKFNKRQYIRFNNNKYLTDNGWILENVYEFNYTSLQDIKIDINPINKVSPTIFDITFESPKISEITLRSYLKVQELIAKVGGLVKGLNIGATILTYLYFSYSYRIHLITLSVSNNIRKNMKFTETKNETKLDVVPHNFIAKKINDDNVNLHDKGSEIIDDQYLRNNIMILRPNVLDYKIDNSIANLQNNNEPNLKEQQFIKKKSNPSIPSIQVTIETVKEILESFSFIDYLKANIFCISDLKKKITILNQYSTNIFSISVLMNHVNLVNQWMN